MSASLARLRKRAAELEQKKQFDRALEVYVQILDEGGKDLDDEDVPLFNRVGDMLMRKGSVTEALGYYERAVDVYAERGYLNNAIALCSKILRQSPGRAAVYYKLARISAKKGFKSDARKNFLEYADRMQKLGMADEAFRALKEFASLYPDQDDVRLVLAELLSKENQKGEALEQLQSLYEKLQSEGRAAEARATIDRMRAIDPSVTPREGSPTQTPAASDLVFLDLTDPEPPGVTPRGGASQPASARAPMPTPVPALTGLSITFFPGQTDAPHPEGFESTALEPEPVEVPPETQSPTPASELVEPPPPESPSPANVDAVVPFEMALTTPASLERVEDALDDLLPEPGAEVEASRPGSITPLSGFEFADLDLGEEAPREPAGREHDLSLPGVLPETPDEVEAIATPLLESDAAAEDARAAAEEAADLAADIAAREAVQASLVPAWQPPAVPSQVPNEGPVPAGERPEIPGEPAATRGEQVPPETREADVPPPMLEMDVPPALVEIPDDFMAQPPSFGATSDTTDEHAFPPLLGLEESPAGHGEMDTAEPDPAAALAVPTPRATLSIGSATSHLRGRLELDPENWALHRQYGEALLDTGERDEGLHELELAMAGFEGQGDLDRAQEVVDEILAVLPGSVAHHQKRVEFAVRSRDRGRLTFSYLELGDSLFRTGSADKAVAVYSRVLELDPKNERAEFALATLAPDELAQRRGGPVRAERWTDELVAIHGATVDAKQPEDRDEGAPDERVNGSAPDERSSGSSVSGGQPSVPSAPATRPRVRVNTIELPVTDWGEGDSVRAAAPAPQPPVSEDGSQGVSSRAHPEHAGDIAAEEEAPPLEASDETSYSTGPVEGRTDTPEYEEIQPAADPMAEEQTPEPTAAWSPPTPEPTSAWSPPTPFSPDEPPRATPDGPPRETPNVAPASRQATPLSAPRGRERTPLSVPTPRSPTPLSVPAPRNPTPRTVPQAPSPSPVRVPAIHSESPLDGGDSDFIDLGEWLRTTEPPRSTRMQVEDPRPTGDEQADFEEMLRRFKRGVAENVEAEDYDAHYDLGVAYKEMGLIDEAIAQFQKSLRGTATRVKSYEALGQCFVEKEQYPIAAALLQRAIELPGSDDQQLVGVLYLLGFATEHMGRPAEARPYYLRVFAVDIEFRDIAERVAALENITT